MGVQAVLFDPVVTGALASACAMVLVLGALAKLRDLTVFRYAVENYRLLPERLVEPFATGFAVSELAAGLALAFGQPRAIGAAAAFAVVTLATLAVLANLLRGRVVDCGCGIGGQALSPALAIRNTVLLLAILLAARTPVERPLGALDFMSWAGATVALLAIYACANQLLGNQQRLEEFRS